VIESDQRYTEVHAQTQGADWGQCMCCAYLCGRPIRTTISPNIQCQEQRPNPHYIPDMVAITVLNLPVNWLPTGETTAKGSPRGVQLREMGPSLGGPGEKLEKPRRKPVAVRDE